MGSRVGQFNTSLTAEVGVGVAGGGEVGGGQSHKTVPINSILLRRMESRSGLELGPSTHPPSVGLTARPKPAHKEVRCLEGNMGLYVHRNR